MAKLDEVALRKPGFTEGYRITLADGQEWSIPKPRIRFKPKIVDGKVEIGGGPSFGPESDADMEVLFGVVDADPAERLRLKFAMAIRLLSTNYELTPDDFGDLLVLEPGDAASDDRWEKLTEALMGVVPKTFARYLRLCARMAGVVDEIDLEDAIGLSSFLVTTGQVPAPGVWVDELAAQTANSVNETFAESFF